MADTELSDGMSTREQQLLSRMQIFHLPGETNSYICLVPRPSRRFPFFILLPFFPRQGVFFSLVFTPFPFPFSLLPFLPFPRSPFLAGEIFWNGEFPHLLRAHLLVLRSDFRNFSDFPHRSEE